LPYVWVMSNFLFKSFLLLCICLSTLFFIGCKKEQPDPPIDYMPQDFKDWMCFKEGTYWVYQDSITGRLDSTVVTWNKTEIRDFYFEKGDEKPIKKGEILSYETYSFSSGVTYQYVTVDRCLFSDPDYQNTACLSTNRFLMQNGHKGNTDEFLYYKEPIGYGSFTFLTARYDSLKVGNQYFKNVAVNWQPNFDTPHKIQFWYYIAKGIGIVQIRVKGNGQISSQQLIRYHIKQ
jgi:hypothetical protein